MAAVPTAPPKTWLDPRRFIEPLLVAFVICVLIANGVVAVQNLRLLQENRLAVRESNRVLLKVAETLAAVTDAETGQRGYVITGDEPYLEPFDEAMGRIEGLLNELAGLTESNAVHRASVARLRGQIDEKVVELNRVVEVRRTRGREAAEAMVNSDIGMRTMERIREEADKMREIESENLFQRELMAVRSYRSGIATSVISTSVGLALVGGVAYLIQRSRRRSERSARSLQIARDRLRVTLASIGDGVISTDQHGHVVFLNGVAEGLTRWTNADAHGQPLERVFRIINETSRETVESPGARALRDGVVVGLANHTLLIARDGHETPIDDSAAPIRGEDGVIRGVVLVFRDVTKRREDEKLMAEAAAQRSLDLRELKSALGKLRNTEQRFRLALEAAEMGAWNIDPATSVLVTDERFRRLFTGSDRELTYEEAFACIHPDDRDGVRAAVAAAIRPEDPTPYSEEYRVVHPNGDVRWIAAKGSPHFETVDGVERLVSFDGSIADITERKRNDEALARLTADLTEADRRKNEFLATLAHELRNPLAPIKNAVQLMGMSPLDPEAESLRLTMARQVDQLVHLIDDLMDVSRISRGKIALRKENVDLRSTVEAAVEASSAFIDENGQTLEVNYDAEGLVVRVDPARLTQVVSNLLNNATKYSDPGCRIDLFVGKRDGRAVVEVSDNGIGIEPTQLKSIFQMFAQVEHSLERGSAGLGIGLTLVKSFVEMHGGTVTAHSEGRGRGSVFTVTLPLSEGAVPSPPKVVTVGSGVRRSFRLLIVEDQTALRVVLAKLLEKMGHQVEGVPGGAEALERLDDYLPEVIFSDISMPGMTGYELVRHLRARPDTAGIYVVAMTGYGQATDREAALEAGFDEHMVKPADVVQLDKLFARLAAKTPDGGDDAPAGD